MTGLIVPPLDEAPWPTLGPQICDLIEERCVFGPGDLRGEPAVIDAEKRALIYRMYEVYPKGHPKAGKRRFKRVCISLRKGTAKTEFAAWIAYVELHPEGPVRFAGWDAYGRPVGKPVKDPYIPMIAYTEEQTEELAYAALKVMCEESTDADLFDPTMERITRTSGGGKALALAAAPNARDGARTTFQHADEPHRFVLPRLVKAWQTMLQNIPKRPLADPWSLSTTTAGASGEQSVAESEKQYAEKVASGAAKDPQLFYFHREASARHDIETDEGLRDAIIEASGPVVAQWSDIDSIVSLYHQADTDKAYFERVWLNRWVAASNQAFNPDRWKDLAAPRIVIPKREQISLGFDGARWRDAAGLVATHLETGHQWVTALWEKPEDYDGEWEVLDEDVDAAVDAVFDQWQVVRFYADPPRFEANVSRWAGKYGPKKVMEWYTNRPKQIGQVMRAYRTAIDSGELTHSGDPDLARHIANARVGNLKIMDDDDKTPLWTIYKERPDSTKFIDLAMAGALSWQARLDAIAAGQMRRSNGRMIVLR